MSTPSIKVGQGNWGIKAGNLLGYANTEKKFSPVEFTSTRALNTATRVNESGNIQAVNADIPRIDYFGGQASLLVEPSAQNLALQSSDYSLTWLSAFLNSTSGVLSPSGTNDATLLESTSTGARIRQAVTLTSGTTYTFSWFGKFGSLSSGFTMNVFDENATTYGSGVCQAFNLNEGTLGASGTVGTGFTLQSVGMENYGSGWYRCRMTVLMSYTPSAPRVGMRLGTQLSGGRPIAVVSGTVNLWGAQVETGSVATSYIPTTTASVTRNADVISVTGVAGLIGQTEGTIYLDLTVLSKGSSSTRWLQIFGASNNIGLAIYASNQFRSIVNAQSDTLLTAPLISSGVKVAWAYDGTGTTCFINGTQYTLTNGGNQTMSSLTSLTISGSATSQLANARIRAVALYTTRLTDAQLAALTTP